VLLQKDQVLQVLIAVVTDLVELLYQGLLTRYLHPLVLRVVVVVAVLAV